MAIYENKDGSPDYWWMILMGCFLFCCFVPWDKMNCGGSSYDPYEEDSGGVAIDPSEFRNSPSPTTDTAPRSSSSSSTSLRGADYWKNKPNGNGRDWFNANYTQKKWLCDTMGRQLPAKNYSQFFHLHSVVLLRKHCLSAFNELNRASGALDFAYLSPFLQVV